MKTNDINDILTIVVPVKNEAKNLPLCLENIKDFEHVIVVDSGSTDNTVKIAQDFGREVVQFHWDGHFPKKRNWIVQNYAFKTPWVMFLDADERITQRFKEEASEKLSRWTNVTTDSASRVDAWICYYDNWFIDRLLKHGDVMRKTAILRIGAGGYEKIDEDHWSHLDMEIHEHLQVKGRIDVIKARLEHYDKRSLDSYRAKHEEYADWEVNRFLALGGDYAKLSRRQRIKYTLIGSWWFGLFYFISSYLFFGGFRDGKPGFIFALGKMRYFRSVSVKLAKARRDRRAQEGRIDLAKYRNRHGLRNMATRLMWSVVWTIAARWTPRFMLNRYRALILRLFGAEVGRSCRLTSSMEVWMPSRLFMGNNVWIDRNVYLYNVERITIGNNAIVSDGAYICTASHDITKGDFPLTTAPVTIGDGAWIAARSIILPGVNIGEGAVVGAGSVVTKDVPPWTVVAGNPAKVVRVRSIVG